MKQNKLVTELCADPRTYIDGVGKADSQTTIEALEDGGEHSALRICLGVTEGTTPLRVLGYIASALSVQRDYLPKAQAQVIHPLFAAHAANGISLEKAEHKAIQISNAALYLFDGLRESGYRDHLTSLFDAPVEPDIDLEAGIIRVLSKDQNLNEKMMNAASSRNGDAANYIAAHLHVHDTQGSFVPIDEVLCKPPIKPERVISIGAQSERLFYAARMACRKAGVLPQDADVQTGQLFTKHVLPPYQQCRQGEPDLYELGGKPWGVFLPMDVSIEHKVASVARDLAYLKQELEKQDALPIGIGHLPQVRPEGRSLR